MKIRFLGTGTSVGVPAIGCRCAVCLSSDPRNRRTRSSIAVEYDGMRLVIDTGPDFRQQMLDAGIDHLDAVLYTHSHADHVFGFDDLRRFNYVQGTAIPIFGDKSTIDTIRCTFRYAFQPPQQPGATKPEIVPHVVTGPFHLGTIPVTPVPIYHGQLLVTGYRLGPFAYLTDCSGIPDSSMLLLKGVTVLVLSALRMTPHPTHFTIGQALETIERLAPEKAFLTHLSHEVDHAAVERSLPPSVFLAYDGLELDVDMG